jgi:FemAB-related protein (PEP-CTERM system-associated)
METKIVIKDVAEDSSEWGNYVSRHPLGTHYHDLKWKTLIEKTFGHRCHFLAAFNDQGNIVGVLPLVNLSSLLFGNFIVSVPYFNYGGIIADNELAEKALLDHALGLAKSLGVSYLQLREQTERTHYGLPVSTDKVNMILQLPETVEELGKSIGSKRRSQCRRATKENVRFTVGGIELLDDYYEVFAENMRDLGTPVYGKNFFKAILGTFPNNAKIAVAYLDIKPVGTGFLMCNGNNMEIPWASTLRETNKISLNMYLYWEILSYAIANNCKTFDFGRSSIDAGTYKFKKQWGAEPLQLYWYKWTPDGAVAPELSPNNAKFGLAIRIWQKLPLWITRLIGPLLVKNLP